MADSRESPCTIRFSSVSRTAHRLSHKLFRRWPTYHPHVRVHAEVHEFGLRNQPRGHPSFPHAPAPWRSNTRDFSARFSTLLPFRCSFKGDLSRLVSRFRFLNFKERKKKAEWKGGKKRAEVLSIGSQCSNFFFIFWSSDFWNSFCSVRGRRPLSAESGTAFRERKTFCCIWSLFRWCPFLAKYSAV